MNNLTSRLAIAFISLLFAPLLLAQQVAITMDNPNSYSTPLLSPEMRDKKILSILKKNHLKIILFAQGAQIDNPQGRALLTRWNNEGHLIGNHTYSHLNLNTTNENEYEQDTLSNETLLQPYTNFKKIFRFPFLKEGDTYAKRDKFRTFLIEHGYAAGSVTIDASDWYINQRLEEKLAKNPNSDLSPYKQYYLQHMWDRAQYYDKLAIKVLGRSPKHTILVHHNLLSALFLDDLIHLFKEKGWKLINANEAFQDPIFKLTPNTLPAGESLIWALAKQTGKYDDELRYPGEDDSYEKEAMDKLGL